MKIRELRELLATLDQDAEIVMSVVCGDEEEEWRTVASISPIHGQIAHGVFEEIHEADGPGVVAYHLVKDSTVDTIREERARRAHETRIRWMHQDLPDIDPEIAALIAEQAIDGD